MTPLQQPDLWIVTGAAGYLGNTIVRRLVERGERVRAVVHRDPQPESLEGVACERVIADLGDEAALRAALAPGEAVRAVVIHTAGVVSIERRVRPEVRATNVTGVANLIAACRATGVRRLVHVASVHAMPEPATPTRIDRVPAIDHRLVHGEYAVTKAEAVELVLAADDLERVVLFPSGLLGPGAFRPTHATQVLDDAASGRLSSIVRGAYDFVDVRDVAAAAITAAERGRDGGCYLVTGEHVSIARLAALARRAAGRRGRLGVLPWWFARASVPLAEAWYRLRGVPPLYTDVSLETLRSGARFDAVEARRDLGFAPRPVEESVRDTVAWARERRAGRAGRADRVTR